MKLSYDAIIIGSGISGLSYALHLTESLPNIRIAIITKGDDNETNTRYAQGGIAVVINENDEEAHRKHIEDTLRAGDGECNKSIVEIVVNEAANRFQELVRWGVHFDKNQQGKYDLHLEGGHVERRIVHYKDMTGKEVERGLLEYVKSKKDRIELLNHHYVIDLIKSKDGIATGVLVYDMKSKTKKIWSAKTIMIATGGIGQIYESTTNPRIATGDGIGLAHRSGISISHMAFVQFHPTALYEENVHQCFLLTEAMRGDGARLLNLKGERFMSKYDERGELASRDIVARAIVSEMKKSNSNFVYLSMTHLSKEFIISRFPTIYNTLSKKNLFLEKDNIPIVPAAHYLCGGIDVNAWGQTNMENVFAVGECSCTGLHGANRLAGNSLLEAIVFSNRAAQKTKEILENSQQKAAVENQSPSPSYTAVAASPEALNDIAQKKKRIKNTMSKYANMLRKTDELRLAKKDIENIERETSEYDANVIGSEELLELRNLIAVAKLIIEDSLRQEKNRGVFFNEDLTR